MRGPLALTSALAVVSMALGLSGGLGGVPSDAAVSSSPCDLLAAPWGRDSSSGRPGSPLASPQELSDRLSRGETGCFRGGSYRFSQLKLRAPQITLRSYPGETAKLRGQLRIEITARGAAVRGLYLDGRNREGLLGPLIYADRAKLIGNEITNRHTEICIAVSRYYDESRPRHVRVSRNVIHDCGELPATNHHHGIYVSSGRETKVTSNVFYGNADRGVQMYPDARGTLVRGNLIVGNGQGVIFGGSSDSASADNTVRGNVIANSKLRFNIESSWPGPTGRGNSAVGNCVWSPDSGYYGGSPPHSGIKPGSEGFRVKANRVERMSFRKRRGVPRLRGGSERCRRLIRETPNSSAGWRFQQQRAAR